MKKLTALLMSLLLTLSITAFTGCSSKPEDPGAPPSEVINQDNSSQAQDRNPYDGEVLENAVSVRIGKQSQQGRSVNMNNNAAAVTMLGYLSGSELLFPTYTYDEQQGYVAQKVRGNYTRDDERTITDVKAGELYLFGGGQLRLYFKDVEGANISATPIGSFADTSDLTEAVIDAYESNKGDTWGVEVYFTITKNI